MASIIVDFSEMNALVERLSNADKDFQKELSLFLEAIGFEFLDTVQDLIIQKGNVDTGTLLASFKKGKSGNIWSLSSGDFKLEIGSDIKYASYVNDGHWTNQKGQIGRWIPGTWNGDKFTYDPNAKTGMYLKQQWIEGSHYFDDAIKVMNKLVPKFVEKKLDTWMNSYFSQFI